jgi:UDP-2,3-diacylglucosamine hydrolase
MVRNSYFVSDLHMFARRSQAERHADAIWAIAGRADTFVLGGDIFDFRWTTLSTIRDTVDAAIRWLDALIEPHPECDFHFVLGNHDSHEHFVERLARRAESAENLWWHPYYVRLGSSLFLHGDVVQRKMTHERLSEKRSRWGERGKRPPPAHWLYDLAVEARLHKMASSLVCRRLVVAKRITTYLDHIGHGPGNGLEHVFFGHTHAPMSNYEYGGLRFHNGGAPIKGLRFRILRTDIR